MTEQELGPVTPEEMGELARQVDLLFGHIYLYCRRTETLHDSERLDLRQVAPLGPLHPPLVELVVRSPARGPGGS